MRSLASFIILALPLTLATPAPVPAPAAGDVSSVHIPDQSFSDLSTELGPLPPTYMASCFAYNHIQLGSATTQNGLTAGGCKPMTIIFARGTTEQGNVGTLSGPPWFDAMGKIVGPQNLAVQGVEYPAEYVHITSPPQSPWFTYFSHFRLLEETAELCNEMECVVLIALSVVFQDFWQVVIRKGVRRWLSL